MELKVVCQCGQKFAFDVEPVGGRMPFTVNCPVCNADGTAAANQLLAEKFRFVPPPPVAVAPAPFTASASEITPSPAVAPSPVGLRINRTEHSAPATTAQPPSVASTTSGNAAPPAIAALKPLSTDKKSKPKVDGEFSLVRGILGGLAGSLVGCGLLFGFWLWAHFRFPLMGIAVGAAAGYGARVGWHLGRTRLWV